MEHATGLRVKTGLLWEALKVDSKKHFTAQTCIEDVWNDMSKQMPVGLLFLIDTRFPRLIWSVSVTASIVWLVLPHLRVPLTCTGVFLVWLKGWYVRSREADSSDALTDWAFEYHQNQSHAHKTRGQVVSACKVVCEWMHPTPKFSMAVPSVSVGTSPDLATTCTCVWLLSCSSALCPVLLCFLLLYEAASSNSDPQEAIHFLIIFTSNRGRRRDADHKFSPPPVRCGAIAQQQLPLIGAVGSNC